MRSTLLAILIAAGVCRAAVNSIDQEVLKGYLENGAPFDFLLIDVRTREEVKAAIGDAACKPYNLAWPTQFQDESAKIPKDQTVILYCATGGRSARAADYLDKNGYTHVYNAGGFLTWTGPTVPAFEVKPASLLPEPSMKSSTAKIAKMQRPLKLWALQVSRPAIPIR
jgi:rhodanese-related sulfurtransferase